MIKNSTKEQLEIIKMLIKLKDTVWEAENTSSLIEIAEKAIKHSLDVEPVSYIFANGLEYTDDIGKEFRLQHLQSDILLLKSKSYSNLQNEKFAIASSIVLLIAIFSSLSINEVLASS